MALEVGFCTNIDKYRGDMFPKNFKIPPRIGESVQVMPYWVSSLREQNLPIKLVVVDVIWKPHIVICELWYRPIDVEAAKLSGVRLI